MDNDGTVDIRDLTAALKREMPHIPSRLAPVRFFYAHSDLLVFMIDIFRN